VSHLLDMNPRAKSCEEELLTNLEECVSEKTGPSLVLETLVTNFFLCVADGAQFVSCIF